MEKLRITWFVLCGLPVALWWSLVNIDLLEKLKSSLVSFYESEGDVNWLSTIAGNAAFYGAIVPSILGWETGSKLDNPIIGVWFVIFVFYSLALSRSARTIKSKNELKKEREIS